MELKDLPEEENACTHVTGKLYLQPDTAFSQVVLKLLLLCSQPQAHGQKEQSQPREKRCSEINIGPNTGSWVPAPVPPLTQTLREPFLLPGTQLSHL